MNELTMHELSGYAELLNDDGMRLLINTAKSLSVSGKYKAYRTRLDFDKEVNKAIAIANGEEMGF